MDAAEFLPVANAIEAHLTRMSPAPVAIETELRHLRLSLSQAVPRADFAHSVRRDYAAILASAISPCGNPIADAIVQLSVPLPWHYHYAPREGEADLADRIAFAELIGPDAPLCAPACRIGFTLMAASTFYPLHAHPAVELYLVIAGHARWTTSEAEQIVPPDGLVLHRSGEPHAMQTFAEPLLALYAWRGNIDAPAAYV